MQYIISTYVKVRVCLCCDYVTLWVMLLWGANWCVRQGESVLWLRDAVSYATVRSYLISFTCTFLSPMMVPFLAVKDSPKLDETCVTDSSSTRSGSIIGTLYFGSPAELPYVSALIKTEVLCTHQLTCYQIGCHLLIHSPSVDTTHFVTITEADRLLLKRKIIHICVTLAWIL